MSEKLRFSCRPSFARASFDSQARRTSSAIGQELRNAWNVSRRPSSRDPSAGRLPACASRRPDSGLTGGTITISPSRGSHDVPPGGRPAKDETLLVGKPPPGIPQFSDCPADVHKTLQSDFIFQPEHRSSSIDPPAAIPLPGRSRWPRGSRSRRPAARNRSSNGENPVAAPCPAGSLSPAACW